MAELTQGSFASRVILVVRTMSLATGIEHQGLARCDFRSKPRMLDVAAVDGGNASVETLNNASKRGSGRVAADGHGDGTRGAHCLSKPGRRGGQCNRNSVTVL